ncbi:hypothetical protein, partial [Arsukibacterium indicum]
MDCRRQARRAKHREVFRNATSEALWLACGSVRRQDGLPRGTSTQKGLPVRVGLLLELGAWRC